MRGSIVGLFVGLLAGIALAFGDFGDFLIVLFIGLLGFLIGRVVDGDLDVSQYLSGRRQR